MHDPHKSLRHWAIVLGVAWPLLLVQPLAMYLVYQIQITHGQFAADMPTYVLILAISFIFIPIANLIGAIQSLVPEEKVNWFVGAANGFCLAASGAACCFFSPMLPFLLAARPWEGWWIFAWGFFLTPFSALATAILLTCSIANASSNARSGSANGYWVVQGASIAGLLVGALLLFGHEFSFLFVDAMVKAACRPASETDRRAAIRSLRLLGNRDDMLLGCYGEFGPILFYSIGSTPADEVYYRSVYHQVTGHSFNEAAPPRLFSSLLGVNRDLAKDFVGRKSPHVTQKTSEIETWIGKKNTRVIKWTLAFENDGEVAEEARAQIKLPKDAVVSDAALWVNGKRRMAAFTARATARNAYNTTVTGARDPLLVSALGVDRVLMQCYPIAPHRAQDMRVELYVTAPINASNPDGTVVPHVSESNFAPIAPKLRLCDATRNHPSQAIDNDTNLFLVVDGSASLAPYRKHIADGVRSLSNNAKHIKLHVYFASDEITSLAATADGAQIAANVAADALSVAPFVGGPNNGPALERAETDALSASNPFVIWIHGPQPDLFLLKNSDIEKLSVFELELCPGALDRWYCPLLSNMHSWDCTPEQLGESLLAIAGNREQSECGNAEIQALKARQHAVCSYTSAVVLENNWQYFQFSIDVPTNTAPPKPAVPVSSEPETATATTIATGPSTCFDPFGIKATMRTSMTGVISQLNALNCYSASGVPTIAPSYSDSPINAVPPEPGVLQAERPRQDLLLTVATITGIFLLIYGLIFLTSRENARSHHSNSRRSS